MASKTKSSGHHQACVSLRNDAVERANQLLKEVFQHQLAVSEAEELAELQHQFAALVDDASACGEAINTYSGGSGQSRQSPQLLSLGNEAEFTFFGYLEGDYSERMSLANPVAYSGGFFVRTPVANILFDPSMGTIRGLHESNIGFNEIDIIVVSHYHPSASGELHTLCNAIMHAVPGRVKGDQQEADVPTCSSAAAAWLIATQATIDGRNDHPSLLIPSDRRLFGQQIVCPDRQHRHWRICRMRQRGLHKVVVEPAEIAQPASLDAPCLTLEFLPACHRETMGKNNVDKEGMAGEAVFAYRIGCSTGNWSFIFTGDTQYVPEVMTWATPASHPSACSLLVANIKTIEYLPLASVSPQAPSPGWRELSYTWNQLGWRGTVELTRNLRPRMLVLRAFGLECVVRPENPQAPDEGRFVYAPEKLAICQSAMEKQLKQHGLKNCAVLIPGRCRLTLAGDRLQAEDDKFNVPAFLPYGARRIGSQEHQFVTSSPTLWRRIRQEIERLRHPPGPGMFLVIQGPSGCGKTLLAKAIATEIESQGGTAAKGDENKEWKVTEFDLAAIHEETFVSQLQGYVKGAFTGANNEKLGLLDKPGFLILNQFEKLPMQLSKVFIDLVERNQFNPVGSPDPKESKCRLVFTMNEDLFTCDKLTDDLRNRLRRQLLVMPNPLAASAAEQIETNSLIVRHWCASNSHPTTLDNQAFELLVRDMDWSNGLFRSLTGVLAKARQLVLAQYPGINVKYVHVTVDFVQEAVRQLSFVPGRRPVAAGGPAGEGRIAVVRVFELVMLFAEEGRRKNVYRVIRSEKAIGKPVSISAATFNRHLLEMRPLFTPDCLAARGEHAFAATLASLFELSSIIAANAPWGEQKWLAMVGRIAATPAQVSEEIEQRIWLPPSPPQPFADWAEKQAQTFRAVAQDANRRRKAMAAVWRAIAGSSPTADNHL